MPSFVRKRLDEFKIHQASKVVDIGSGVANVVVQATLEKGCEAFGVELSPRAAGYAVTFATQLRARAWAWNVDVGRIMTLQNDFRSSVELAAVLPKADLVFVNNLVFPPKCRVSFERVEYC